MSADFDLEAVRSSMRLCTTEGLSAILDQQAELAADRNAPVAAAALEAAARRLRQLHALVEEVLSTIDAADADEADGLLSHFAAADLGEHGALLARLRAVLVPLVELDAEET